MKNKVAETGNLRALRLAYKEVSGRSEPEKIAIVAGSSGTGKTTSLLDVQLSCNAIRVEASPNWTTRWMLHDICGRMGLAPSGHAYLMEQAIARQLLNIRATGESRPLFIDESNFLVEGKDSKLIINLLGTLYRLHDRAGVPLVLFGLKSFPSYLREKGGRHEVIDAFAQRVVRIVEFQKCGITDAQTVADTCCEVRFDPDAIRRLTEIIDGSFRTLSVLLKQVESVALRNGCDLVELSDLEQFLAEAKKQ